MSLPAPLMFTVGLIDQITKPIAKIRGQLNGLSEGYQKGTMQMASGIGGVVASGYTLQNALMPAIEMSRALGEVKSLGVQESALKTLSQNSYKYALQYGESATEFVRSSYDIQSAIAGLSDTDLSRFTMASNVLAKGTKSDAATITSYMGTMYGIFKNDAMQMGEGAWVERLTGMTATAVQAFKTDGKKMADAFGALGASAGLAPLEEQMAIMGTLQATMQGSESATKYKAFLAGVGKAQKALNLQFSDANGNMLPIVDILNKIKGKYGDVISVAEGDALATAFGSQEAVSLVKLLMNDINGLSGSINMLGKVNGMDQAVKMAEAMTDPLERLNAYWYVIRSTFGTAILPVFNLFVKKIAEMGNEVLWFTEMFPNITRMLGYVGVGILSFVAAGGLITIMMGAATMAMAVWTTVATVATGVYKGLAWAIKLQNWLIALQKVAWIANTIAFKAYFLALRIGTSAMWLFGVASKAVTGTIWLFSAGLSFLRGAMLAVNIAMAANPIGLIVVGIAAAIAAIGALIYYWDDLKATMSQWEWLQAIGTAFSAVWEGIKSAISGAITLISSGFSSAFGFIVSGWQNLVGFFLNMEWVTNLIYAASSVGDFIASIWTGIKDSFGAVWDWIVDKLSFFGVDLSASVVAAGAKTSEQGKTIAQTIAPIQTDQVRAGVPPVEAIAPVQTPNYGTGTANNIVPFQQNQIRAGVPTVEVIAPVQSVENNQNASRVGAIEPIKANTPRGGITQQIANANTSKSTSVGQINIYPQKVDPDFANYVEMHA